jgi:deoxyadenosine/deoxycytidine kinase
MGSTFSQTKCPVRVVFVEGNIGAGKTRLLQALQAQGEAVVLEDSEAWTFLKARYADPERWGFTFQVQVLTSMLQCLRRALTHTPPNRIIYMERSFRTARVFSKLLRELEHIQHEEYILLHELCMEIEMELQPLKTATVVVECTPETCLARLRYRDRHNEVASITSNYLVMLETKMEQSYQNVWLRLNNNGDNVSHTETIRAIFSAV